MSCKSNEEATVTTFINEAATINEKKQCLIFYVPKKLSTEQNTKHGDFRLILCKMPLGPVKFILHGRIICYQVIVYFCCMVQTEVGSPGTIYQLMKTSWMRTMLYSLMAVDLVQIMLNMAKCCTLDGEKILQKISSLRLKCDNNI